MLDRLFAKPTNGTLAALSKTALAEIARAAASALAGMALPAVPGASVVVGSVGKEFVTALTKEVAAVERKVDKLIQVHIVTGLQLLLQALDHSTERAEELRARDELLDDAHLMLTQAHGIASDSREEAALILALDVMALANRTGHELLAESILGRVLREVETIRVSVSDLEQSAVRAEESVMRARKRHRIGQWTDVAWGVTVLRALHDLREMDLREIRARAELASSRLETLSAIVQLAEYEVRSHPRLRGSTSP